MTFSIFLKTLIQSYRKLEWNLFKYKRESMSIYCDMQFCLRTVYNKNVSVHSWSLVWCFQVSNAYKLQCFHILWQTFIYHYIVYIYNVLWPCVSAQPLDERMGRVGGEKRWGLWSGCFEEAWQNQLIRVIGSFSKSHCWNGKRVLNHKWDTQAAQHDHTFSCHACFY